MVVVVVSDYHGGKSVHTAAVGAHSGLYARQEAAVSAVDQHVAALIAQQREVYGVAARAEVKVYLERYDFTVHVRAPEMVSAARAEK